MSDTGPRDADRLPWPARVAFAVVALWVVWLIGAGITGEARWGLW